MIAFFRPRALFTGTTKQREITDRSPSSGQNTTTASVSRAVVLFSHHRDVKVALEELKEAGFSNDYITLIGRHAQRCWENSELIINNYFDAEKFGFNQVAQEFFHRLFRRGKYLVLITGSKPDVSAASKIMSRRKDHAEVWYFE